MRQLRLVYITSAIYLRGMKKLEKHASRLNLWSSLAERASKAINALGGWSIVAPVGAVLAGGWTATIRYIDSLPIWLCSILALLLTILTMHAFIVFRRALSVRGLRALDLEVLAVELTKFKDDVFELLTSRQKNFDRGRIGVNPSDNEAMYYEWQREMEYSQRTRLIGVQQFAHRAVALVHMLNQVGIEAPSLWSIETDLSRIAAHFGAIGALLEKGLLAEAKSLPAQGTPMALPFR